MVNKYQHYSDGQLTQMRSTKSYKVRRTFNQRARGYMQWDEATAEIERLREDIDLIDDELDSRYPEPEVRMDEIEWFCPICGAQNLDVPELTALPMCGACDTHVAWHIIMAEEHDEPEVRRSKTERKDHTRDGDSVKLLQREIGKRGAK